MSRLQPEVESEQTNAAALLAIHNIPYYIFLLCDNINETWSNTYVKENKIEQAVKVLLKIFGWLWLVMLLGCIMLQELPVF